LIYEPSKFLKRLCSNTVNKIKSIIADLKDFRIANIQKVREIKLLEIEKQLQLAEKNNNYLLDKIKSNYVKIEQFKDTLVEVDKIIKNKIIFFTNKLNEYHELNIEKNESTVLTEYEEFKYSYLKYAKPDIPTNYLNSVNTLLVCEGIQIDLKKIKFFDDDSIEIIFRNKSKHKIFNDGLILSFLANDVVRIVKYL
jgi:hypothetical protein